MVCGVRQRIALQQCEAFDKGSDTEKIVTDTTKSSLNNFAGTKTLATLAYPADTPLTMSSREIAELVEARHNDVVATIERLFGKGLLRSSRKTRR